jgi:hypothetical protein
VRYSQRRRVDPSFDPLPSIVLAQFRGKTGSERRERGP